MLEVNDLITSLHQKVSILIDKCLNLQKQCEILELDNIQLQKNIEQQAISIRELEKTIETEKATNHVAMLESSTKTRHQIDELLREIDKCIADLNK